MHLHKFNSIQFGFIVLCPQPDERGLRATCRNIKGNYPKSPLLAVIPSTIEEPDRQKLEKIVPMIAGGDTYASLINEGMKKSISGWNFVIFSGSGIKYRFAHKYCYFVESEKDVLFPIIDGKYSFVEGSLNGLLVHKRTFELTGELSEKYKNLEAVKLLWHMKALKQGCLFKAIAGVRIG